MKNSREREKMEFIDIHNAFVVHERTGISRTIETARVPFCNISFVAQDNTGESEPLSAIFLTDGTIIHCSEEDLNRIFV